MTTLYTKSTQGHIQQWSCWADGAKVCIEYGRVGGSHVYKETVAKPKNVGRANETTAEQQALKEVEAKVTKQLNFKYYKTIKEASGYNSREPMLCSDYRNSPNKVKFPCYASPKLNGFRLLNDKGTHYAKSGETYDTSNAPHHLKKLFDEISNFKLDGEIYSHGMPLQEIISAWRVPTLASERLKYYIYDIPNPELTVEKRLILLENLGLLSFKDITIVKSTLINTQEEYDKYYSDALEAGYEGVVTRNCGSFYEFGKRSGDMIKRKPRPDSEAKVIGTTEDRLGDGIITCVMKDGVTTFKCKMLKKSGYRGYEESKKLIGKWINYEYEEFSNDGIPTKPVGMYQRDCDELGNPLK